jgi:uncharacterized protein (TIGR02246 family)
MKYTLVAALLFFGLNSHAQGFNEDKEKTEIEQTIKILVDAWRVGDANKFAAPFTEDADFMVWFGLHLKGKEEIAFGHNIIFKQFYANTIWDLKIAKIRFLGNNVALVHAAGAIIKDGGDEPTEPDAVPLIVLNKIDNNWKIVALQNTPFAVNEFRANGDLQRMKRLARENIGK